MSGFMIDRDGIGMNNRYFRRGNSFCSSALSVTDTRWRNERSLLGEIFRYLLEKWDITYRIWFTILFSLKFLCISQTMQSELAIVWFVTDRSISWSPFIIVQESSRCAVPRVLNRKILSRNNAKLHHQSRTRIALRSTDLELTIGTLCHSIVALWSHCILIDTQRAQRRSTLLLCRKRFQWDPNRLSKMRFITSRCDLFKFLIEKEKGEARRLLVTWQFCYTMSDLLFAGSWGTRRRRRRSTRISNSRRSSSKVNSKASQDRAVPCRW